MSESELLHVASLLDSAVNMFHAPINRERRAAIFAAIDSPSMETWKAARATLITPGRTLWQATAAAGMAGEFPTAAEIIHALEVATAGDAS
jgi:hypothetical protein